MDREMKKIFKNCMGLRNRHFLIIDTLVLTVTPALALFIRLDHSFAIAPYTQGLVLATLVFAIAKLAVFYTFGFYRRYWRYAGIDELGYIGMLICVALVLETFLLNAVFHLTGLPGNGLPRSLPLLDAILSFIIIGCIRFSIPAIERLQQRGQKFQHCDRLLIVGAGSAGISLLQKMQQSPQLGLYPAAFIDDDPQKLNLRIRGVSVLGNRYQIPQVVRDLNIRKVIIAIPTASGKQIREIVEICQSIGIPTSTLPGISEILGGRVSLGSVREVQIEDLLRRASIQTESDRVSGFIRGKKVLITGAGGSIGSELCRQVLKSDPEEIILVGHGENSVFNIQQELNRVISDLQKEGKIPDNSPKSTTFIADIRFVDRLEYLFQTVRPNIIFHAAAHKHVPMMELNPPEAITNNVRGTKNLLDMALKYDVEHFVMISTDKAVNPTNIMGASKRVAEMLVLQAAKTSGKPFVVVRFGNVLGSRGSVVPTFKRQIAEGGPITITHPDICRYFMTIPEAVQLLLQAAVLGNGGQVFMLDMGEPVRIVDLAKDLIRLSGYELGKDIDIVFTGLRPGEKLFEELFIPGETYDKTEHEKILILGNASRIVRENIEEEVEALCEAADRNDANLIVFLLEQLVPEYVPGYSTVNLHSKTDKETTDLAGSFLKQADVSGAVSVQVEKDLRQAIQLEEFRLYYQPVVSLETNKITAFEALLRWQHPTRGLLVPGEFIPAAEASGLIVPIGEWVLRQACSQLRIWQQQFDRYHPLTVSVNLTGKQFFQPDFVEQVGQILKEKNLNAASLKLELSEEVVTHNSELANAVFVKLKALGVKLQIDHCGLSDKSLTRLHRLIRMKYGKLDGLKLDCSVVSGLDTHEGNLETLQKIIAIAQELDMGTIATGVETSEQIAQLKAMKCAYGQGYFFSKPVAPSEVERSIEAMTVKS